MKNRTAHFLKYTAYVIILFALCDIERCSWVCSCSLFCDKHQDVLWRYQKYRRYKSFIFLNILQLETKEKQGKESIRGALMPATGMLQILHEASDKITAIHQDFYWFPHNTIHQCKMNWLEKSYMCVFLKMMVEWLVINVIIIKNERMRK